MGKLNSNLFLSQKNDRLNDLLYIPNKIKFTLENKVIKECKQILIKHKYAYNYEITANNWYAYTYMLDISDEERQQLKELYQNYKDSDNIVKEIKWYVNRLFNVDAPLHIQKLCIPEYYWKYLIDFNYIDYKQTDLHDWNHPEFFNQGTYDLMEQQPLKAVLLGVEI